MTYTEAYKEHIMYTFNVFCKTVIRFAAINGLLDAYARKLAANMNKGYEITARVPSIMIAGGSNFPVRKKEKQNAAADKNMQEFTEIQGLLDKIRSTGMGGINADDPNAVSKLEPPVGRVRHRAERIGAGGGGTERGHYRPGRGLHECAEVCFPRSAVHQF